MRMTYWCIMDFKFALMCNSDKMRKDGNRHRSMYIDKMSFVLLTDIEKRIFAGCRFLCNLMQCMFGLHKLVSKVQRTTFKCEKDVPSWSVPLLCAECISINFSATFVPIMDNFANYETHLWSSILVYNKTYIFLYFSEYAISPLLYTNCCGVDCGLCYVCYVCWLPESEW